MIIVIKAKFYSLSSFSNLNYSIKKYSLKLTKYSVSYSGPTLWNTIFYKRDKKN